MCLILLSELAEDVVFTVLLIHLLHKIWIARAQIDNLVLGLVDVVIGLCNDLLNYSSFYRADTTSQKFNSMRRAHQEVLEHVVDQPDILVDHSVHNVA